MPLRENKPSYDREAHPSTSRPISSTFTSALAVAASAAAAAGTSVAAGTSTAVAGNQYDFKGPVQPH